MDFLWKFVFNLYFDGLQICQIENFNYIWWWNLGKSVIEGSQETNWVPNVIKGPRNEFAQMMRL